MKFNDDMIQRLGLPSDVMGLIHDLAYDHDGRDRWQYRQRAQEILKRTSDGLRSFWFECNRGHRFICRCSPDVPEGMTCMEGDCPAPAVAVEEVSAKVLEINQRPWK